MAVATACFLAAPVVALDGQPAGGRYVGASHFGLLDLGGGVQKFSCHYEADLDPGGVIVLDIGPPLWRDGWRIAGEDVKAGAYEIDSVRTGRPASTATSTGD